VASPANRAGTQKSLSEERLFMYSHSTFTSESVCAGHPDKLCDQISDAILDEVLRQDPFGRVAVECLATKDRLVIAGEVSAQAVVDYEAVARREICRLGYTIPELHFTHQCVITVLVHEQSPEIGRGVSRKKKGAGDQGMMFGFACRETSQLMPLPIMLAHALTQQIDILHESGALPYLRPDGKAQVTVRYEKGEPVGVETIVLAVPHSPQVELPEVRSALARQVVDIVLGEAGYTSEGVRLIVNGTGVWHCSGPAADTGLTGRKIIVDTYGGYARVGGGAFSGKDPSKVDRSGAYAARFLAKNLVAAGLAKQAEVRLAYCIGEPQPVMKEIECFGTATVSKKALRSFVDGLLDCSAEGIIETLALRQPQYLPTAAYGHFGREGAWERVANLVPQSQG
jgi:S-adenosylmethionine synthetase